MAEKETSGGKVTFVLTGPREGFTGVLGGMYQFVDGKLEAPESEKEYLKKHLCVGYACNIVGEAPMWETNDKGGSVKVGAVKMPKKETTTVKSAPVASTNAPAPKQETKKAD